MKIKNLLMIILLIFLSIRFSTAQTCPTSSNMMHDGAGMISNVIDNQHINMFDLYWCLSRTFINDGHLYYFFNQYQPGIWYFDNAWSFYQRCCGCAGAYADIMIAKLEQNRSPNTISHSGEYTVELAERRGTGFYFTRTYNRPFSPIPTFHISSYSSTGPGSQTTVTIDGWGNIAGPAHYWIIRADGSSGDDLPLSAKCYASCNSTCADPILGYQMRAMAAGSLPVSGDAPSWGLTVNNGTINGWIPVFPFIFQIQNPSTCISSNRYIYIATQLRFADGFTSEYISENSIAMDWCNQNPAEAGKQMQCQKSGATSLACSYANGGSCATDNTIYYGLLSAAGAYGYSGSACLLGNSGNVVFDPGSGDWFWIIVSNNGTNEGSYGKNSSGIERPEAVSIGSCDYPQNLNNTCQ